MYAVVGCGDCDALWIVSGRPETTGCPRCGTRHRFDRLRRLVETDDEDRARTARAALLAERSGHEEALNEIERSADLDVLAEEGGPSDEAYFAGWGIDADAVEAAGERAGSGRGSGRAPRPDVVRSALRELDQPTEGEVAAYAAERGVPEDAARRLLARLVRAGEAIEDRGRFRAV